MRLFFCLLISCALITCFAITAKCQTCTGSLGAPVINETFGAGAPFSIGPPLAPGLTTLKYVDHTCGGEEGEYDIINALGPSCKGGTWQSPSHDHTGDPGGYFMAINGTIEPSVFFTYRVSGSKLCPNTTYQFAAWLMNLVRTTPSTKDYSLPNITFRIETVDGKLLNTPYNTGDIPESDDINWIQYATFFTSPADGSDVVVKLVNNGGGGFGNDLAMDDITFSPCGALVQAGFGTLGNTAGQNACLNDNLNYTFVAQQTGYPNPTYQWQQNKNDAGWANIPNETGLSLQVSIPNAAAGKYQYRIGVLSGPQSGSESCRIFSAPLIINVYKPPTIMVAANTAGCSGHPLQLSASGGTNFSWSGPNNFTSTDSSPVVSYNAGPGYDGIYTVKVSINNCPSFANTTVRVYPAPTAQPLRDISICAGDAAQLEAHTTNVTHFQWSPADGLDHTDIANPIATPKVTTTYTVSVTNDGCNDVGASASMTVKVIKRPVADAGKTLKIFEGQAAKLNATAGGDDVTTYWTPAEFLDNAQSLTPTTNSRGDITYTLHVVSADCGEATSSVFVRVYNKLTVFNSFSPNGDGINDLWSIKNIDNYPKAHINVYTRYGQAVFESTGYGKAWDGSHNGSKLPAGTYYYIIDLNEDNLPKQAGWFLIIR